jgi:hypothetical protein
LFALAREVIAEQRVQIGVDQGRKPGAGRQPGLMILLVDGIKA